MVFKHILVYTSDDAMPLVILSCVII